MKTKNTRDAVRAALNGLMYSKTPEEFDLSLALFNLKFKEYEGFIDYFNKLWIGKKQNWCLAWIPVCDIIHLTQNKQKTYNLITYSMLLFVPIISLKLIITKLKHCISATLVIFV